MGERETEICNSVPQWTETYPLPVLFDTLKRSPLIMQNRLSEPPRGKLFCTTGVPKRAVLTVPLPLIMLSGSHWYSYARVAHVKPGRDSQCFSDMCSEHPGKAKEENTAWS